MYTQLSPDGQLLEFIGSQCAVQSPKFGIVPPAAALAGKHLAPDTQRETPSQVGLHTPESPSHHVPSIQSALNEQGPQAAVGPASTQSVAPVAWSTTLHFLVAPHAPVSHG